VGSTARTHKSALLVALLLLLVPGGSLAATEDVAGAGPGGQRPATRRVSP